MIRKPV